MSAENPASVKALLAKLAEIDSTDEVRVAVGVWRYVVRQAELQAGRRSVGGEGDPGQG